MKTTLILIRPLIATGVLVLMMTAAGRRRDPITQAYLSVFGLLGGTAGLAKRKRLSCREAQNSSQVDPGLPLLASFLFVVTVTVAAFDLGRSHWSPALPAAVRITSLVLLTLSGSLQVWAMAVNPFFCPSLSIQVHHQLIATGPYRVIRHPGYLAMLVTMPATAVTLGSLAALLPALGYDLLILNRTMREDGFLQKKLGATRNTPGWFIAGSSPAYGEVLMRCPKCNSDECTRLSLVYLNGISDIRTRSRGRGFDFGETAGAFSFRSRGRGTFQTRLSKLAGPPRKLPYRHVILWWALGLAIMYWLFGELVWLHELSPIRSVTLFPQYAHAYSGLALLVLASLGWYNHQVRSQRLRLWERLFMCDRCGHIFQPLEEQEAA